MDRDDPEKRIAELERQLAEQKRIAELERQLAEARAAAAGEDRVVGEPAPFSDAQGGVGQGTVDDHAVRYAQALWEGLRTGGPAGPDMAQLREALARAAAGAGMSQEQLNDALQHAHVTIKTGHSVVYGGQGNRHDFGAEAGIAPQPTFVTKQPGFGPRAGSRRRWRQRKFGGASRSRTVVWTGLIVGVLATVLIPSSALWTSQIMCRSPYHLAHTSSYSYGHGTEVSFQCVSSASSYAANFYVIAALQCLLAALVAGIGVLLWRLLRKPG